MNHRIALLLGPLLVLAVATPGCGARRSNVLAPIPPGAVMEQRSLVHDGRTRTYQLYVPASLPEQGAVPVVLALHGGLGSGAQLAASSHLDEVAEEDGFVIAYPNGVSRTWNGGYCCGPAQKKHVDDVGFLVAVVDELSTRFDVDPGRVFALGHSNGGIMAYRLACERADRFAAIGVVAGSMGGLDCVPSQPVSIIHIHGDADKNHPIDGAAGPRSISRVRFNSAMGTLQQWAAFDGCEASPRVDDTSTILTRTWPGCDGGSEIVFHTLKGGGHAWPGGTPVLARIIGPPSRAIDASRAIWEFFAAHGRG